MCILIRTVFTIIIFLTMEMEACTSWLSASWFISTAGDRSWTDYNAQIQTKSSIINNWSSRIKNTIPGTKAYIIVGWVLDYIYVGVVIIVRSFLLHILKKLTHR